uniref:Cystatin domain-containing protein n=1 Tax=Amblyomma maculatum TaxID=34609 RepID=G3MT37_AMBMU
MYVPSLLFFSIFATATESGNKYGEKVEPDSSAKYLQIAKLALQRQPQLIGILLSKYATVLKVTDVQVMWGAGWKIEVKFTTALTDCYGIYNSRKCSLVNSKPQQICIVRVFEPATSHTRELASLNCTVLRAQYDSYKVDDY